MRETRYKIGKKRARQRAISWQCCNGGRDMSYSELSMWGNIFHRLGKRFGLLMEFRENAIPC